MDIFTIWIPLELLLFRFQSNMNTSMYEFVFCRNDLIKEFEQDEHNQMCSTRLAEEFKQLREENVRIDTVYNTCTCMFKETMRLEKYFGFEVCIDFAVYMLKVYYKSIV